MSKRRTPRRRQPLTALSPSQRRQLESGTSFFNFGADGYQNIDEFKESWRLHGDALRAEFIKAHPGRRPFGDWLFELVPKYGERLVVKDFLVAHRESWLRWGILHTTLVDGDGNSPQEPEWAYLKRHGLLTDAELKLIEQEAVA